MDGAGANGTVGVGQLGGESVTIGGIGYRLTPLSVAALGELEAWVKEQLPDPIAVAREIARDLPPELAQEVVLQAYHDVRGGARRLGSPEATRALNSLAGFRELLYLHGRTHQPQMTREDWERVLQVAIAEDSQALAERLGEAQGGAIPDPKAASSSATTAVPPTGATSPLLLPSAGSGTGIPSPA